MCQKDEPQMYTKYETDNIYQLFMMHEIMTLTLFYYGQSIGGWIDKTQNNKATSNATITMQHNSTDIS